MLVAKRVTGEEEVPEGAVAVLTPDAPDVLSHVSVRARNMKVLFAICHEEGTLKEVEDKEGKTIALQVSLRHAMPQHADNATLRCMLLTIMFYHYAVMMLQLNLKLVQHCVCTLAVGRLPLFCGTCLLLKAMRRLHEHAKP